ncbi:MAG: flagellar motor switch protein FliN [Planctomycetota bacterium]|nr:flagellar motor switch protein FliN [Planctomycetota bacterium]
MAEEQPQSDQEATDAQSADAPEQAAAEALQSVEAAAKAVEAAADDAAPIDLPDFEQGGNGEAASPAGMNLLKDVSLNVKIELGRTQMYVEDVLRLNADSVIELDKAAGDPVDIYVNDRHVARGEVLVLNENFCVRISEIIDGGGGEE